jgi:hypothetical protein
MNGLSCPLPSLDNPTQHPPTPPKHRALPPKFKKGRESALSLDDARSLHAQHHANVSIGHAQPIPDPYLRVRTHTFVARKRARKHAPAGLWTAGSARRSAHHSRECPRPWRPACCVYPSKSAKTGHRVTRSAEMRRRLCHVFVCSRLVRKLEQARQQGPHRCLVLTSASAYTASTPAARRCMARVRHLVGALDGAHRRP